MNELTVR